MKQVPLCGRVIFSDWHGVLSRDPFWVSIRGSVTHPLHDRLEASMAGVFARERTANEWMTGLLSSDQVIAEMGIALDRRFRDGFLARRLDIDCARMRVNAGLFDVLRVLRTEAMVVIATDNMDCFARAFTRGRHRNPRRGGRTRDTLADWAIICDDIICSSDIATLKAENPRAFFGTWLDRHGIRFTDAVLIDDRADNCAAFTACGGTAIQWKMGTHQLTDAETALRRWLDMSVAAG